MLRNKNILVISTNESFCRIVSSTVTSEGHTLQTCATLHEALREIENSRYDAAILDVSSRPPRDYAAFTSLVRHLGSQRVWMVMPLGISPWNADAQALEVNNFLKNPVQRMELEHIVSELPEYPEPSSHSFRSDDSNEKTLKFHLEELPRNRYFLAACPAMLRIYETVKLLAAVDVPVLVLGESGVGKDVVANLLHEHSKRSAHNFTSVNCAALPPDLLESELFGYEAGAFTGAVKAKPGKFELADHGTLLLDEIGEMSAPMQAKLLHVLQDGRYSRLGARSVSTADVRIVAATNVNIENAIADKLFREDLYYRISTFTISIPPLRERREEIPFLVEEMLRRQAEKFKQDPVYISPRIMSVLQGYSWPGNLRELSNVVIRIQILNGSDASVADIESKILGKAPVPQACPPEISDNEEGVTHMRSIVRNFKDQTESRLIQQALEAARWNRRRAATALSISYRTLLYKIDQYHLKENRMPLRVNP